MESNKNKAEVLKAENKRLKQDLRDLKDKLSVSEQESAEEANICAFYEALSSDQSELLLRFSAVKNTITFANKAFEQFADKSCESLKGMDIFSFIFMEDRIELRNTLQMLNFPIQVASCKLRLYKSDEKISWMKWTIRAIYTADACLLEYQAIGHEISELKLSKPLIQDAVAFRKLTETIPVMVYVYHGTKVIYVNPAVEKNLGFSQREMLDKTFWDICHPDYKELIRTRGLARLRGEDVPDNYEFKIVKKSGEEMWVNVFFGVGIFAGERVSIVGAYDITENKKLREELQGARSKLELRVEERTLELIKKNQELTVLNSNLNNVVENMSDGVFIVSRSGECEVLNPVFEKNWGNLIKHVKSRLKEDILEGRSTYVNNMFNNRKAFQDKEIIFSTPKGNIQFLASGTPIVNERSDVTSGIVILKPIKEVHKLVNRFSGAQASFHFDDIITASEIIFKLIEDAKKAASSVSNILIEGESGTGKELFAQAIHNYSKRSKGPFVAVNCGAIPRELIGSELFGYSEGAFTGAKKGGSPGKFELASGGTLFLDEIGDMPFEQQVALLRVIQEKKISRIGGQQVIPVDVRIICATNKNLLKEIENGNFRRDLYYRLNVIYIKIPPLRERRADIPVLFKYFLKKTEKKYQDDLEYLEPELIEVLSQYNWPGNVRELQNVVERMLNTANGADLSVEHFPPEIYNKTFAHKTDSFRLSSLKKEQLTISEARKLKMKVLAEEERCQIIELLDYYQGNVSKVAREMGMARSTLYKKMKSFRIDGCMTE